jgi:hypothetical protein
MMRRTVFVFAMLPLQPSQAVPLAQSKEEAAAYVKQWYGSRWFGADSQYMLHDAPQSHYVPFFLARGKVDGVFSATCEYRENRRDENGKSYTETYHRSVAPQTIRKSFFEHNTQVYAGFRRDPKHVRVLQGEHIPTLMKPLEEVDVARADDMNAVEMSLSTLQDELESMAKAEVESKAREQVREFHSGASRITIHWQKFNLHVTAVTPVFVPAWIVPVKYGEKLYKVVVCGVKGTVSGPRLYNPESVARASATAMVVLNLLAARFGMLAVWGASFPLVIIGSTLAAYYGSFNLATRVPDWRLQKRKRDQDRRKAANASRKGGDDSTQQQQQHFADEASEGPGTTAWKRAQHLDDDNDAPSTHPNPQDPKGYYITMGISRHASVNEIKAAFRKHALKVHPDVAKQGSKATTAADMSSLNQAYQVLRRKEKRRKYDDGDPNP